MKKDKIVFDISDITRLFNNIVKSIPSIIYGQ